MAIKGSQNLRSFLRTHEGYQEKAYIDAKTGRTAIGYGDTLGSQSGSVSRDEAERRMESHIGEAESYLSKRIKVDLPQNRQDVLIDMYYNAGPGTLEENGFFDLVNTGDSKATRASIEQYTKSTNEETKEKEELKALVRRRDARLGLWDQDEISPQPVTAAEVQAEEAPNLNSFQREELFSDLDQFAEQQGVTKPQGEFDDLEDFAKTVNPEPVNPSAQLAAGLETSSLAVDEVEDQLNQGAREVSEVLNIPTEEAKVLLIDKKKEDVIVESRRDIIAKYFPGTAAWAQEPDNYVLLRETGDWATQMEVLARPLNKTLLQDYENALSSSQYIYSDAATLIGMTMGTVPLEEGQRVLAENDYLKNSQGMTPATQAGMKEIEATGKSNLPKLETIAAYVQSFLGGKSVDPKAKADVESFLKASEEGAGALYETIKTYFENPRSTSVMATQSLGTILGPGGGSVVGGAAGAAIGAVTPIPGGAAGGMYVGSRIGAFAGGTFIAYGEYITKELEAFRDSSTGKVNYKVAFSDPARVAKWRNQAALYGVTMGGVDAATMGLGGRVARPIVPKAGASILKRAAAKTANVAVGAAKQSVAEGVSQTAASSVAQAAYGELTPKRLAENFKEGLEEALISPVGGAITTTVQMGVSQTVKGARVGVSKVAKADVANRSFNFLNKLRAKKEENPKSKERPQQTEEMVRETVQTKPQPDANPDFTEDTKVEAEEKVMYKEATNGTINISPKEFDDFHAEHGGDPVAAMQSFGPSVFDEYTRNKGSDVSITLPLETWLRYTEDNPLIDSIGRINGNDLNAIEGDDVVTQAEENPLTFFEMTAYHGSPYDFDKFSTDAIGTGEGAQAFGYGLYFTEDKDIAEYYRKTLTESRDQGRATGFRLIKNTFDDVKKDIVSDSGFFGKMSQQFHSLEADRGYDGDLAGHVEEFDSPESYVLNALNALMVYEKGETFEQMMDRLEKDGFDIGYDGTLVLPESIVQMLRSKREESKIPPKIGQTFEVDIKAEKDKMLDWRKNSESQPESVMAALKKLAQETGDPNIADFERGEVAYKRLRYFKGDKGASEALREAGVPGIRYKAESGKSDKENFVIFSDQDVSVRQKFYESVDGEDVPESMTEIVEEEEEEEENIPTVDQMVDTADGSVMRPVQLVDQFRADEDRKAFKSLATRLKSATKDTLGIKPETIDVIADLEFRRLRARAKATNRNVADLVKDVKVGKTKEQIGGSFSPAAASSTIFKIVFGKGASAKTLVHELGHSWLWEMSEDSQFIQNIPEDQLTEEQKEYKESMRIAADLFGMADIGEVNQLTGERLKAVQEKFAQTTERYFLEGKFENSQIRSLMESFRKWMTAIADYVAKSYPQFGSFEISPQVERMFEILLDAQKKIEDELYPMMPEPMPFTAEMLGKDGQAYLDAIKDAESEAIRQLYAKSFVKSLGQRERDIDAQLNNIMDQATLDVDQRPSMQLLKHFEQLKKDFPDQDIRISSDSLRQLLGLDLLGFEQLKAQLPRAVMMRSKAGGIAVEQVMEMMDISDPQAFVELLIEANKRDQMIEARSNEIINDKFPAFKSDEDIHEEAVKAVQGKGRDKILALEMKVLAENSLGTLLKGAEKVAMPPEFVNAIAKEGIELDATKVVMGTRAKNFSADKFLMDSARLGRKAANLFKKKKILEAFGAKRQEAVAFNAFKQGKEAQTRVAETRERVKQFAKYTNSIKHSKRYDVDIMSYGRQIIEFLSKDNVNIQDIYTNGDLDPRFLLTPDKVQDQSGLSDPQMKEVNKLVRQLMFVSQGKTGNAAQVENIMKLGDFLDAVFRIAREAKTIERDGKKENREEIQDRIAVEIGPRRKKDRAARVSDDASMRMESTILRTELSSLMGSDEAFINSGLGEYIWTPTREAEAEMNLQLDPALADIRKTFRAVSKTDPSLRAFVAPMVYRVRPSMNMGLKPIVAAGIGPINPKTGRPTGVTFKRGKPDVLMSMLLAGSESGLRKLILGGIEKGKPFGSVDVKTGKIDDSKYWEFIESLIKDKTLTQKDFDFLEAVWASFEKVYPKLKESIRQTEDRDLGYVKAQPIKTSLGTLSGGYVPVTKQQALLAPKMIESLTNPDNVGYSTAEMFPYADLGYTNERTEDVYPVDLDLSRITAIISAVYSTAYLRPTLINVGKILASDTVSQALEARRPGIMAEQIVPWFERVKLQEYTVRNNNASARLARGLRNNSNVTLYLGALGTIARQYAGIAPVVKVLGPNAVFIGTGKVIREPVKTFKDMTDKSPRMRDRLATNQEKLVRSWEQLDLNNDWITTSREGSQKAAFYFIQLLGQNRVDTIAWTSAYWKGIRKGMSKSKAVAFADDAVEKTQGSSAVSAQSNLQHGDDFKKLWTQIGSVQITNANLEYEANEREETTVGRAKAKLVAAMFLVAMPVFFDQAVSEALDWGDDEEDEDKDPDEIAQEKREGLMLKMATTGLENQFPIIGRIPSMALSLFGGGYATGVTPSVDLLTGNLKRAVQGAKAVRADADMTAAEQAAYLNLATLFTGLPFSVGGRMLRFNEDVLTSSEEKLDASSERRELLQEYRESKE